jgi:hypothetical protein
VLLTVDGGGIGQFCVGGQRAPSPSTEMACLCRVGGGNVTARRPPPGSKLDLWESLLDRFVGGSKVRGPETHSRGHSVFVVARRVLVLTVVTKFFSGEAAGFLATEEMKAAFALICVRWGAMLTAHRARFSRFDWPRGAYPELSGQYSGDVGSLPPGPCGPVP